MEWCTTSSSMMQFNSISISSRSFCIWKGNNKTKTYEWQTTFLGKREHQHVHSRPLSLEWNEPLPQLLPLMPWLVATHRLPERQRVALWCFQCLNHYNNILPLRKKSSRLIPNQTKIFWVEMCWKLNTSFTNCSILFCNRYVNISSQMENFTNLDNNRPLILVNRSALDFMHHLPLMLHTSWTNNYNVLKN